ncbi:DM13 domain-containing protein [Oscillochloris sp. ZM17-4]|uniref:DM13 domain-containing protein n=1 Tax=Oscillochloris sp. ZM17-4 TaxID=2866714 RepID=UPI001C734FF4|nr:DM13 domain-containing protein [Oscillochloris sp. ZM17-4]MBX0327706.1 DM13 domain-containing protein [Oscillochloris sp. ZM17-4]
MATDTRPSRKLSLPWFAWAGGAVVLVAVVAFAYWTISPLFRSSMIDEAFPGGAAMAGDTMPGEAMPANAMADTPADAMSEGAMADAPAEGTMSEGTMADTPADVLPGEAMADTPADAMAEGAMAEEAKPTAAIPAEPVALSVGSFTTIDSLHGASGTATIYRLPEGNMVLRLENFDAQNGPDLFVGLSGHAMPRSSDEVHAGGYLELARLKANQGNQNYDIPADADLSQYKSVVIYCRAFSVVFSTAELGM